jgi:adsorption protein B
LWIAAQLGAPVALGVARVLVILLKINAVLLAWRILVRASFVTATYGLGQGLLSIPRLLVGNFIAILAVKRAIAIHSRGGPQRWEKTRHMFPREERA